ncbi:nucleotidyl transferase AbiEii/AbiGii toxin family protein [Streptosporangium sp. NBC_01755]|nr:nucleotidyl transferase AbiEii/AbiGii toxin family protein [Streptosporangium sp. NBC_01810]WSA29674.1 nucleotidyl transferase AbiEii/AbiGii toxin family protein [Streptosporangium sp. NBC_01810]WSC98502.1 nucleotidyl transferase AbiEii/AbiGii toxin family protein [Streptosporangium sp. NBC_01755]
MSQLRRQFAYDRALARCFSGPSSDRWVLKGGISILALLQAARHSSDLDLCTTAPSSSEAFHALQSSLSQDLGDHFSFHLQQPSLLIQGVEGVRASVTAFLGRRPYERFHVDLVTGVISTGTVEHADPLVALGIPGLHQPRYRLYPLCDTLADKIYSIGKWHSDRPSTRFRDLVDIVLIAVNRPVDAARMHSALSCERLLRKGIQPTTVTVADEPLWEAGYAKAAASAPGLAGYRDLHSALLLARRFVDPVLNGVVTSGTWEPTTLRWQ